jgi:hypothetical protein
MTLPFQLLTSLLILAATEGVCASQVTPYYRALAYWAIDLSKKADVTCVTGIS